jgi:hypothetical protein
VMAGRRCVKASLRSRTPFSVFLDIFYPTNFRRFEGNRVFQHPRLFTSTT